MLLVGSRSEDWGSADAEVDSQWCRLLLSYSFVLSICVFVHSLHSGQGAY